jgi:hypothetical protein
VRDRILKKNVDKDKAKGEEEGLEIRRGREKMEREEK